VAVTGGMTASTGAATTGGTGRTGAGASTTGSDTGFAGCFGGAAFLAGAVGAAAATGNASRRRRATGASTVDDALFTNSPSSLSFARTSLLGTPSSFASSCTRALPATGLLVAGLAVTRTVPIRWETQSFVVLHRVLIALRLTFGGFPQRPVRRKPSGVLLRPICCRVSNVLAYRRRIDRRLNTKRSTECPTPLSEGHALRAQVQPCAPARRATSRICHHEDRFARNRR
jgi:hypothetical protein